MDNKELLKEAMAGIAFGVIIFVLIVIFLLS